LVNHFSSPPELISCESFPAAGKHDVTFLTCNVIFLDGVFVLLMSSTFNRRRIFAMLRGS
jgi:hypothetical protein